MTPEQSKIVVLSGAVFAMLFAAPAMADMRARTDTPLILAQNEQDDWEEERRRNRREERRNRNEEREERSESREDGRDNGERRRRTRRDEGEDREERHELSEREKRRKERRERQEARQEERERNARERREKRREERDRRARETEERRDRQEARKEERERKARERRQERQAQRNERQELEKRLREKRERRLREAEERRIERNERRRHELSEQQEDRRERARQNVEQREDERQERRIRRLDRIEGGELSQEERNARRREFTRDNLGDIKRARRERRENGRLIIDEPGNRRIIRDGRRVFIEEDDSERLRGTSRDVRVERGPRGRERTIITRPNGVQIITVRNDDGEVIRRVKKLRNGKRIVLFNNGPGRKRHSRRDDRDGVSFYIDLPDVRIGRPRRDYYVYADRADENEIESILSAEPLVEFAEDYTLEEVRYSPDIRARLRKLNVNTVNFSFGSWEIREDQFDKLEIVARVIKRIIDRDASEVFLLAGHTDLVGSEEDNLSLSGRRAETVARILTDEFDVPPENLVTQGYGESDPLINTQRAEAANRRVEFMRITPALAQYDEDD